jgi:hypothetical protein
MLYYFDTPGLTMDSPGVTLDGGPPLLQPTHHMKKIRLGLQKKSVTQKFSFGQQLITKITNNAAVPDTAALLAEFVLINNQLGSDHNTSEGARQTAQEKTSALGACQALWNDKVAQLAMQVELETGGNAVDIQSCGFDLRGTPAPIGELPAPTGLTLRTNGISGVLKLKFKAPKGAEGFVVERTTNPNQEDSWEQVGLPMRGAFTDQGLTPGTRYWYRVAANGTAGLSGWSGVIWMMAI